jgi:excisionase family DNA binding protein
MDPKTQKLYTTHEVAKLLGVTPITVIRWIESGKFKCYTTVGGHRRIGHEELIKFAKAYNLPWRGDEEVEKREEYVVLSVDDEPDMLEMEHDMLSGIPDLRLISVSNGFTASAKLVEERPDLVLLDFLMPELDGFEFCRFVREDPRFKDLPIVAVTGLKNDLDLKKIKEAGVTEVLSKPFSAQTLVDKVEYFRQLKKTGRSAA